MKKTVLIIMVLFALISTNIKADSTSDSTKSCCSKLVLNANCDIVSRYIFRGLDYGNSPAFQPTLSIGYGGFEFGGWGSIATNSNYKELDLYAKYSMYGFTLSVTDYYVPFVTATPASPDIRYFVFDDKKTAHTLEAGLLYKGPEKLPFWVSANVMFFGNDKRWGYDLAKDTTEKTYNSSYFEAGYTFNIGDKKLDIFAGGTPVAGAFGNNPGIINIGFTGYKSIKISDKYELPVKAGLIYNPQVQDFHFVFGITF